MAVDLLMPSILRDASNAESHEEELTFGSTFGGLLASTTKSAEDDTSRQLSLAGESFGSGGLLSGSGARIAEEREMEVSKDQDDDPFSQPESSFGTSLFTKTGLLAGEKAKEPNRFASSNIGLPSSISSDIVPVHGTGFDGKRIYFSRRVKPTTRTPLGSERTMNLLEVPIHRLRTEIAVENSKRDLQPSSNAHPVTSRLQNETLWVDRYKPARFTDLLGDERVHRETMAWVKQWDHCVFGKQPKNKHRKRPRDEGGETSHYEDDYHRPREKILLLSGPPGLGKTTLANVVAKQAGYEVMEINASDARTGSIIDDRIRPALEAGSMVGRAKPVLVVIDEIDGATGGGENMGGFVQKLLELTFDKPKRKSKKKTNDGKRPLLRPIICICNDLYSSALVRLRPICKIVRFKRAPDVLLNRRLREVCSLEGLKIDAHALGMLTRIGQGDIRACLNALQYLNAQHQAGQHSEITEPLLRSAVNGMKESEHSMMEVLNDLFAPPTRKRAKELGFSEQEEAEHSARFVSRLSRLIDSSGSQEKVALGCFEHYCTLHQTHDLGKFDKVQKWLGNFDILSSAAHSEREFALMPYLSYFLVPFYTLFSERGGRQVERPKADWEHYQNTRAHDEVYKSLAKCLLTSKAMPNTASIDEGDTCAGVNLRHLLGTPVLQLEFAPLINRIISPPLRPVNKQIIRTEERAQLNRLVKVMTALDLQFILDRNEEGHPIYRLEPPIEMFVTYEGKRAADIPVPRFATRQLIAVEIDQAIEKQKMDVKEKVAVKASPSKSLFRKNVLEDESQEQLDGNEELDGDHPTGQLVFSSGRGYDAKVAKDAKPVKVDPADKPPVDFFGRPIIAKPTKPAANVVTPVITNAPPILKKFKVTYQFNQGSSAAVRRPIKVAALL